MSLNEKVAIVTGAGSGIGEAIAVRFAHERAKVVIAEITAPNQNVYYEIGFAHALNKPTILLAQHGVVSYGY